MDITVFTTDKLVQTLCHAIGQGVSISISMCYNH